MPLHDSMQPYVKPASFLLCLFLLHFSPSNISLHVILNKTALIVNQSPPFVLALRSRFHKSAADSSLLPALPLPISFLEQMPSACTTQNFLPLPDAEHLTQQQGCT